MRGIGWLLVLLPGLVVAPGCRDDGPGDETGAEGTGGDADDDADDGDGTDGTDGDDADSSGDDGEPSACLGEPSVGNAPLRRLTRQQYANAVRDLLGITANVQSLDDDEKAGPFDANVTAPVSAVTVEQYRALAENIATEAASDVAAIVSCDPAAAGCGETFVQEFGRLAYRRPLTPAEQAAYAAVMDAGESFEDGLRVVVQTMLQSPNFLYVVELSMPEPEADAVAALDGYEMAARLSLFLWNSIPDAELLDAAEAGELGSDEGVAAQAERLLADSRARDAIAGFHVQWLGVDDLETATKDTEMYPEWGEPMREAMARETGRFAQAVILAGDGKLETLLSADFSYLEDPLFDLYDVDKPEGHTVGQPVQLNPDERAGLLTQAGFLASHAHADHSGPIQRGVVVRTNLLCTPPPPPPPGVNAVPPTPDPDATTREIFEMHTANPECAGCHQLIDGIGLGFEGYDALGIYRETEHGLPVDQSGEVFGSDVDGPFVGAVELAEKLSVSQDVRNCVARQWFRYAFGRIEDTEGDACSLETVDEAFAAADYDVRALMVALVQTDAFRYRAVE